MTAVRLTDLTTVEAKNAGEEARLAIVPVGSTEQHGPHLSVATDSRIAEEFATRLAGELGNEAVLCPLFPYGLSEHHERFSGTVSLSPTTYVEVFVDLVSSLSEQGFEKVIIVNGHGGNMEALTLVARRARSELGVRVASMMWSKLARDVCASEAVGSAYGHACELETSLAMVLAPDVVRNDRICSPAHRFEVEPLSAPPGAYVDIAVRFDELTPDGVYGDPTKASRALGNRILSTALARAVSFSTHFLRTDFPTVSSPNTDN